MTLRRTTNAACRLCVWIAALGFTALVVAWVIGRIANDRSGLTQYLYWIPTPAVVGAGLCALAAATVLSLSAMKWLEPYGPPRRAAAKRTLIALWLCTGALGAYVLLGEWHALRYIFAEKPPASPVRIVAWNAGNSGIKDFARRLEAIRPRILALANPPFMVRWDDVLTQMGARTWLARHGRCFLASAYPILRWGGSSLNVSGTQPRVFKWEGGESTSLDKGEAMYVELDTTAELGRAVVIWIVDLPADPDLPRMRVLKEAAATVATFRGPRWRRDQNGLDVPEPIDSNNLGFPKPDIIVGDFNTPRGSASMRLLVKDMTHAFDQAGRGFAGSWPGRYPILAIDHAFLSDHLRAVGYDLIHVGGTGHHRAQVVDVVAK